MSCPGCPTRMLLDLRHELGSEVEDVACPWWQPGADGREVCVATKMREGLTHAITAAQLATDTVQAQRNEFAQAMEETDRLVQRHGVDAVLGAFAQLGVRVRGQLGEASSDAGNGAES